MCCDYRNAKGGEPVGETLLVLWRSQREQLDQCRAAASRRGRTDLAMAIMLEAACAWTDERVG